MDVRKPFVPIIVGPTGVGKTAVALELARLTPVRVISADSRQIYRGLDIGTAKPTADERRFLPHDGLDVVDVGTRYSAGQFVRDASQWIHHAANGRRPVVVGGTGLYIRALVDGLFTEPPLDHDRRERLHRWMHGVSKLDRWAARLEPAYEGGGYQRAARALEVVLLTGRPLSWWQRHAKSEGIVRAKYFVLTLPRALLHERIRDRVDGMLARGLIEEVRAQLDSGVDPEAPGLDAVGYAEVVRYLQGSLSAEQLAEEISRNTRQYAKRQETWFRNQLPAESVTRLRAVERPGKLATRILELLEQER